MTSALRIIIALARSTHPGPTVLVSVVALVLGIGVGLEPVPLALVTIAVLSGQMSIGLSNDWIDVERDRAVGRTDKPVAAGEVTVATARIASVVALVLGIALLAPLGWQAAAAHAVFLVSAWGYNAGLKSTIASIVPYLVSFGLLPSIVTLASGEPRFAPWWGTLAGALLGAAAHVANVLPDLESDRATGIRGLPHRLGRRVSATVIAVSLSGAAASIAIGAPSVASVVGLAIVVVLAVASAALSLRDAPGRIVFRLIMASALVAVVMLALAGSAL